MGKKRNRTYDNEFKLNAVKLCLKDEKPDNKIAEELGIRPTTLATWKSRYLKDQENVFSSKNNLTKEQKRIKELEKENKSLTIQRDILKKALTIFSQENNNY